MTKALEVNDTLMYLNLNNTELTSISGLNILSMLQHNKKLILLDIERNSSIDYDTARKIQDRLMENKALYDKERRREWQDRKELADEEVNLELINRARQEEILTVKEMQKRAQDIQLQREQIYVENQKKQEEERKRMEKKIEKEATQRAKNRKRKASPKK